MRQVKYFNMDSNTTFDQNFDQRCLFFILLPFPPSLTFFLYSAHRLLCQCVDSLRRANPFDIGWIDSCWQDAPCHFVCCHLIGLPQFAIPFPFFYPRSLWPGYVWHQTRQNVSLQKGLNHIRAAVWQKTDLSQLGHKTLSVMLLYIVWNQSKEM